MVVSDVAFYLVAAPFIYALAAGRLIFFARLLESRPMVFIGKRSYAAYVLHMVVAIMISTKLSIFGLRLNPTGTLEAFVYFTITMALASFSYRYIEAPILGLRDRTLPPRK